MDTAVLESNVYAKAWTKTVKPEKKKSFDEAVAQYDAVPDWQIQEVRRRDALIGNNPDFVRRQ